MQSGEPLPAAHLLDGRYRINKVIGAGGMGRVYLSNDTRLSSRPVAVKEMIVGDAMHEQKALADFTREARVLALLTHPGIPNIIDFFTEGNRHYLVMEFVAGGDLQHLLDQSGGKRMPESMVLKWSRQMLDVLDFLHSQTPPIVYRDLKPGNIMIDKDGRAMLIDFGIARFLPPGGRGTQIGSVGYAPPEQYMGKTEPRSDLYSLAATMHHLLTGRDPQLEPPFSFPPVRQLAPEVSIQTEQAVMKALDKDLSKRPTSARELKHLLPDPDLESELLALPANLTNPGSVSRAAAPISNAATMVLPSTPFGAYPSAPPSPSARPSGVSSMKTVVLPSPPTPSAVHQVSPPPMSRKPPANIPAPVASKPVVVSSTAKTQDLKPTQPKPAASPKPPPRIIPLSRPMASRPSTPPAPPKADTPAYKNGARAAAAGPVPKLIARPQNLQFDLTENRMVIGRAVSRDDSPEIDLSGLSAANGKISRRHAEIIRQGANCFIRDLGSLNGTYIAGRGRLGRDQLYKLKDCDEVVLGEARLQFRER